MDVDSIVKNKIKELFDLDKLPESNDHIFDDLCFDDLDYVELIVELESEFNIVIYDLDFFDKKIFRIHQMVDYIQKAIK